MATKQEKLARLEIPMFEGTNSNVGQNISKKIEPYHTENARSRTIGTIEKRQGTRRLGNEVTATANYGIKFFENSGTNGFYRVSTISATTSIYYLNDSAQWTALTGNGTSLTAAQCDFTVAEGNCFVVNNNDSNRYVDSSGTHVYTSGDIGDSTTQFDITNPSGNTIRYTYDGTGTDPNISQNIQAGDIIHITASNFSSGNKGWFEVDAVDTNYFEITNASGVVESNKTIGTGVIRTNNHLTDSPIANKINYFKDRLYLGDYTISSTRYKNGIMMSSPPLGLVSLVDGDYSNPITSLSVTDLKYIKSDDVLDVYRGGTLIGTIIVTGKDSDTNTLTIDSFGTDLKSSDELWVGGTRNNQRVFRWEETPESGTDVKQYDTFKISGEQNNRIKMMTNLGDYMVIANDNNIAFWNSNNLSNSDVGIGCVSDTGYVKNIGALFFVHYTGMYAITPGEMTPRLISSKIQRIFDGATVNNLENLAMGKKDLCIFASLGNVSLYYPDGSSEKTLSDTVVEYNIKQKNWYQHTGISATQFETYKTSSGANRLEFSCTETDYEVREFLTGSVDDAVSSDNVIPFRIDTGNITLSDNYENICYPMKIIIEMERGSGAKIFVSLDNAPFYEIDGDIIKGCSILKVTSRDTSSNKPPRCRRINISIRENTKKLCKISRIAIIYKKTTETENKRIESYQ